MLAIAQDGGFVAGIENGLTNAWQNVVEFAPKLIGALLILLVGWIIARVIRNVARRVFERVGLDRLLERAGLSAALRSAGYTASELLSKIIYWIALLVVILMASDAMNVQSLSDLLNGLISYLPLVIVAMVIVIIAAAVGSFVAELVAPWAREQGVGWVAMAARWAFIIFGIFAALNTLNVASDIVNTLFMAVLATAGVAFAIAFGVGGIKTAERYWNQLLPNAGSDQTQ